MGTDHEHDWTSTEGGELPLHPDEERCRTCSTKRYSESHARELETKLTEQMEKATLLRAKVRAIRTVVNEVRRKWLSEEGLAAMALIQAISDAEAG